MNTISCTVNYTCAQCGKVERLETEVENVQRYGVMNKPEGWISLTVGTEIYYGAKIFDTKSCAARWLDSVE